MEAVRAQVHVGEAPEILEPEFQPGIILLTAANVVGSFSSVLLLMLLKKVFCCSLPSCCAMLDTSSSHLNSEVK